MEDLLKEARERVVKEYQAVNAAKGQAARASAELVRLQLIELADRTGLESVSFELEYCYDDEGGYYNQVLLSGTGGLKDGGEDDGAPDYEDDLYDIGTELDEVSIKVLCGLGDTVTIEDLRGARF